MLLFLEIFLTIAAWRKGFKAFALFPLGFALLIGFIIGATSPELVESGNVFSLIWIDILAIIILGIMVATGNETATAQKTEGNPDLFRQGNELPEH